MFFADTHYTYIHIYRRTQTLNPSLRIGAPGNKSSTLILSADWQYLWLHYEPECSTTWLERSKTHEFWPEMGVYYKISRSRKRAHFCAPPNCKSWLRHCTTIIQLVNNMCWCTFSLNWCNLMYLSLSCKLLLWHNIGTTSWWLQVNYLMMMKIKHYIVFSEYCGN